MQRFETKKALLIYAGKNPDDRKLVDRWMSKGIVWMEDGMYCTNLGQVKVVESEGLNSKNFEDAAKILELSNEIDKLKEENRALKMINEKNKKSEPVEDLYYHLKFFYEKFMEWKKFVDGKAYGQMKYNNQQGKQDTMEMVSPEVYSRYNFTYDEVEKSECEFTEDLIRDRQEKGLELPF